jgi:hypothetical protein
LFVIAGDAPAAVCLQETLNRFKPWQTMEGLTMLRPEIIQTLLELCNSVKVTRLCLYMADKNQFQWFKKLNTEAINLGSGKRSIVKGGTYNDNYQITVPDSLEENPWI